MRARRTFLPSLVTVAIVATATASAAESARLMTYAADGQTTYALSLAADMPRAEVEAVDVVVLFDTSASQQGAFRESALSALETMLAGMRSSDRVQIVAVDLDPVPMMKGFAAPASPDVAAALDALRARTPLGSTNLARGLQAAIDQLEQARSSSRAVAYIGDGMSMANMLDAATVQPVIERLQATRTPVSSYAIGPEVHAETLAMLANQSGGNLYVAAPLAQADEAAGVTANRAAQENQRAAQAVGKHLAGWTRGAVLWPTAVQMPDALGQVYPSPMPPLRSDRDTVLLGQTKGAISAPVDVKVTAVGADGHSAALDWNVAAEPSSQDQAYLVELVDAARRDRGLTLPTLGSAGLAEAARLVGARADELTMVAERAIASGDKAAAARITRAVLQADPGNVQARTVQNASESDDPFGGNVFEPAEGDATATPGAVPATPAAPVETVPYTAPAEGDINLQGPAALEPQAYDLGRGGSFLDEVEQERRVFQQMLDRDVTNTIRGARGAMRAEPLAVIQELKLALENVRRVPNIDEGKRAELIDRIEIALREATNQASIKDELDRQRESTLAAARDMQLTNERLLRNIEREKQLMDRFDALMDDRKYPEAEEVAEIVEEIDPDGVTPRMAVLQARHVRHKYLQDVARSARHAAAWDTLYQIELSHIPFPDNPPIVYPDAPIWLDLTKRRKARYASVDLKSQGEAERRIYSALREPLRTPLEFIDAPLSSIMDVISEEYDIPIQFDQAALDAVAQSPETEVTVNVRNVSLRSAMELIFKNTEDLTYIVDNEVLLITTEDEANTRLQVKVYPVADLVLPIESLGGGMMGGMMGGGMGGGMMGGGMGGGMMGGGMGGGMMGGMGGGMGGGMMGGGMGGGGGFFAVPDPIAPSLANPSLANPPQTNSSPAPANDAASAPAAAADVESPSTAADSTAADSTAAGSTAAGKAPRVAGVDVDPAKTPAEFWNGHFASAQHDPQAVRAWVTRLVRDRRFDHAIALIQAAIGHGQAQPWMYESLGIAMELGGSPKADVERAIMSACDFSTTPDELMLIARYLSHMSLDARAVEVYRQVIKAAPLYQEAYAQALQAAERAHDLDGIRWATVGILRQAWPTKQEEVRRAAVRIAKATLEELKAKGEQATYDAFEAELDGALVRDCLVKITWSGDADVDLIVEEPGGTVCSLQAPRTESGGVWLGDSYAGKEASPAEGFSETYICPEAFAGEYRVRIRKVWGELVAGRVTVDVYKNFRTPQEQHEQQHIAVGDDDAAVVFTLDKGRRTDPVEQVQLAAAVGRQNAIQGAVLAQQLGSLADPGVIPDRSNVVNPLNLRRALALARGGQVGFMPQITVLPEGTQFFATAVVSADRRYVRITAAPNFSSIGNVTTFTFAGPGTPVDPGNGGGNGGGGGGGGGGNN